MADVKWIKIVTDIFDDEKILLIESLPDADSIIVIWFKLLCLAGKQNNSGVFIMGNKIPYTDGMLATVFRRRESTVKLALQTFEQFGMIEIVDGVITIPNWGKHQNLDQLETKKTYMKNYMKEYREKQKALTSGDSSCKTNSKTNSKANVRQAEEDKEGEGEKEKDTNNILTEFEELWKLYPRKEGKQKALAEYQKARKNGTTFEDVKQGIEAYCRQIKALKTGTEYIKHGSTWFYNKSWQDEYSFTPSQTAKESEYDRFMGKLQQIYDECED